MAAPPGLAGWRGEQKDVERKKERMEGRKRKTNKKYKGREGKMAAGKEGANDELAPIRQSERGKALSSGAGGVRKRVLPSEELHPQNWKNSGMAENESRRRARWVGVVCNFETERVRERESIAFAPFSGYISSPSSARSPHPHALRHTTLERATAAPLRTPRVN